VRKLGAITVELQSLKLMYHMNSLVTYI